MVLMANGVLPVFLPLKIQNQRYDKSDYIYSSLITLGNNIDTARTTGNVVFGQNSDVTFEGTKDIELNSGVVIKNGANLTLKSKSQIRINALELEPGATIELTAPKITIGKDVVIPKGAKLITNIYNE